MYFISSRTDTERLPFKEAFLQGRPEDGGIYMPEDLPVIEREFYLSLGKLSFREAFASLWSRLVPELSYAECAAVVAEAFDEAAFGEEPFVCCPLNPYKISELILLADGGRGGFIQDYANALTDALLRRWGDKEHQYVLYTDGTEASARSLCSVYGADSTWKPLYLLDHRTEEEELRELESLLLSSGGEGIWLTETSPEAELLWHKLRQDEIFREELFSSGVKLLPADGTSPLSLVTSLILLIYALSVLENKEWLNEETKLDLAVPMLDPGFVLAAVYAKGMGLPIARIFCADNRNKIFTDFLRTGRYNVSRKFFRTGAPAMDKLLPPMLEALVFELCGRKSELLTAWLNELEEKGSFQVPRQIHQSWDMHLASAYSEDKSVVKECRSLYDSSDYLLDAACCTAFSAWRHENKGRKEPHSVLVLSAENPVWTAKVCGEALFGRAIHKSKDLDALRSSLLEEAGIRRPSLLDQKASAEDEDKALFQTAGAEDYLTKIRDLLVHGSIC